MPAETKDIYGDIHDFSADAARWGWAITDFSFTNEKKTVAKVVGCGNGLKVGDHLCHSMTMRTEDCDGTKFEPVKSVWYISEVEYQSNPRDLFFAKVTFAGVEVED